MFNRALEDKFKTLLNLFDILLKEVRNLKTHVGNIPVIQSRLDKLTVTNTNFHRETVTQIESIKPKLDDNTRQIAFLKNYCSELSSDNRKLRTKLFDLFAYLKLDYEPEEVKLVKGQVLKKKKQ